MKNVTFMVSLLFMLGSCTVEETGEIDKSKSDYIPMEIGNYWVYQNFYIDPNGIEHQAPELDSIIITKDTIINGKLFYRSDNYLYTPYNQSPSLKSKNYLRDSSGYLIDFMGNILFSESNFTDTLSKNIYVIEKDTVYWLTYKMEKSDKTYNLLQKSIDNILNFKGTVIANPKLCPIPNPRYTNTFYGKGIGKFFYSNIYIFGGGRYESRLIKYRIY